MENITKVTSTKENMRKIGNRIKECRKRIGMTQEEVIDAILKLPENKDKQRSSKQLSAIENGRRELSAEYAYLLAKVLNVRYEYLMCEDDYKTDNSLYKRRIALFDEREKLFLRLIRLAGYEPICDFISNWKELGIGDTIYGPFQKHISRGKTILKYIPDKLDNALKVSTEIRTPNGKTFYCDSIDFQLLEYELIEFIHFRMKQLESRYAWLYDDGHIEKKAFGSEIEYYEIEKEVNKNPDFLASSIWVDHTDEFFPSMNR